MKLNSQIATMNQPFTSSFTSSLRSRALKVRSSVGRFWCTLAHDSPMWPIGGRYQCRRCFLYHPVRWEIATNPQEHRSAKQPQYPGKMPKGLSPADLEKILDRATRAERERFLELAAERKDLGCGHRDEV